MKLNYTFEFVDLDDEIIMVPIGANAEQVHGVLKVNKTGQEIISLLAEQYVQSIVKTLQESNLLEGY